MALNMAREMQRLGLPYEMTEPTQMMHMLSGSGKSRTMLVIETRQTVADEQVIRVFYGYLPIDEAKAVGRAAMMRRSVTDARIVQALGMSA